MTKFEPEDSMRAVNSTRICVPVVIRSTQDLRKKVAEAAAVANVIELRLDYLPAEQHGEAFRLISNLVRVGSSEFIITLRTRSQGGECDLNIADQIKFWKFCFASTAAYSNILFDLEIDLVEKYARDLNLDEHLWNRVICSYHDFQRIPADLNQLYERIKRTPARIIKIAVTASDITDSIPVLNLIDQARSDGHEVIAIAMGEAGTMTRILGPSRGAFLTYAQLNPENRTASGQLSATSLNDIYRLKSLNAKTVVTGLVGYPIGHSVSPNMHNAAFAEV
ncbi:MAG: type I 3-dehydroquinate dehydratase, partial [Pyrinomonadaceae bacterium]